MARGYYISKRKTYDMGDSLRRLVLIKGSKAMDTPMNKMTSKLKLKGYQHVSGTGDSIIFEKWVSKKKKLK